MEIRLCLTRDRRKFPARSEFFLHLPLSPEWFAFIFFCRCPPLSKRLFLICATSSVRVPCLCASLSLRLSPLFDVSFDFNFSLSHQQLNRLVPLESFSFPLFCMRRKKAGQTATEASCGPLFLGVSLPFRKHVLRNRPLRRKATCPRQREKTTHARETGTLRGTEGSRESERDRRIEGVRERKEETQRKIDGKEIQRGKRESAEGRESSSERGREMLIRFQRRRELGTERRGRSVFFTQKEERTRENGREREV